MSEEPKWLCAQCVGEEHLSGRIVAEGEDATCSYCGRRDRAETIEVLADRFEAMMEAHFEREGEIDTRWDSPQGESAEFIIGDTGMVPETAAVDIQAILEDRHADFEAAQMGEQTEFDPELTYVAKGPDDREFREGWDYLERTLKTRRRFFSREAEAEFEQLFDRIHALKTQDGRPVVKAIGPETDIPALYRARVFQAFSEMEKALIDPQRLIGSPESRYARAGRMNAHGVSVFYGATTEGLALAEVRPPVGSRAVVGRFDLLKICTVLDVDALGSVLETGSLFDPAFAPRLERAAFLKRLARRISMPVMPDDEATDYVVTQAMADYLADRMTPALDGVAYSSPQGGEGVNVALFHPSARVRPGINPPDAEMSVHPSGHDDEIGAYMVWADIDSSKAAPSASKDANDLLAFIPVQPDPDRDLRADTLALDRKSLIVHHVDQVCVRTTSVKVDWMVWDKADAIL